MHIPSRGILCQVHFVVKYPLGVYAIATRQPDLLLQNSPLLASRIDENAFIKQKKLIGCHAYEPRSL
jgi:hypothetical protein